MSGKEILTLQFGHYSNFTCAHLWNINDLSFDYSCKIPSEINHNVLYREGLTNKGHVTYTPRALLVDLKGSLQHLPLEGVLYSENNTASDTNWYEEKFEIKKEPCKPKPKFIQDLEKDNCNDEILNENQNLDLSVNVWSDFLYTRFHPRTVNIINDFKHEDNSNQFNVFPLGTNLWKSEEFSEVFVDKIRNYLEECDNFQGFHVVLDAVDGFSGLASSCIEYLRDEYDRKSVLAIPIIPSHYKEYDFVDSNNLQQSAFQDSIRVTNIALCYSKLSEFASVFVPLCTRQSGWRKPGQQISFYRLNYNSKLWYHSSAILASAVDTFTLKHRLRSSNLTLSDLCSDLSGFGRKAVAASLCLPFSFNENATFIECLDKWEGPLTKSITPNCTIGSDRLMQYWILRGIPIDRLKLPQNKAKNQQDLPAYKCNSVKDMLELYLACNCFASANNVTSVEKCMVTKTPYPNIFDPTVGVHGNIVVKERPQNSVVQSVPVLAGLHSGAEIGVSIESLHTEASKVRFPKLHQFKESGLEMDEYNECLQNLFDLRECYESRDNM